MKKAVLETKKGSAPFLGSEISDARTIFINVFHSSIDMRER